MCGCLAPVYHLPPPGHNLGNNPCCNVYKIGSSSSIGKEANDKRHFNKDAQLALLFKPTARPRSAAVQICSNNSASSKLMFNNRRARSLLTKGARQSSVEISPTTEMLPLKLAVLVPLLIKGAIALGKITMIAFEIKPGKMVFKIQLTTVAGNFSVALPLTDLIKFLILL